MQDGSFELRAPTTEELRARDEAQKKADADRVKADGDADRKAQADA